METYTETIYAGSVAWDQRNVFEFVNIDPDPNPESPQGKNGLVAKVGYTLTWGHLSAALVKCHTDKKRHPNVMLAVQTQIGSPYVKFLKLINCVLCLCPLTCPLVQFLYQAVQKVSPQNPKACLEVQNCQIEQIPWGLEFELHAEI